ncbi:MAG: hypothetical protein M3M99_06195, partial [Actinomycetota bacterium]|nr:hypothetical protein [Actinomycetota bacterium]
MIGTSAHGRILAVAALALAILIWLGPLSSQANRRAGPTATVAAKAPKLPCLNQSGSSYRPRVEPAACAHFGPGGSFGGGVLLESLVWSGWGAATATAAGTECGFHL